MKHTKSSLFVTLFACMGNGKAHYTKASIDTIRGKLELFHDIVVGRRWTFQSLADIESEGYIRRKTRYYRKSDGTFVQISSMITFTLAGVKYLVQKRVSGALKLLKQMIKWLTGGDHRWPQEENVTPQWTPEDVAANKTRFTKLLAALG